ncbi:MAG: restriction endonuclease subunit S [Peptostreptococcaceae bacterium]|uniref:restriction endonuclease subunit S n=1 Tax=Criibacterium bergeronii TaxID=1871336 RepID=UPI00163DCDFF|nr:restriction endonuclease subunit S [Criibacterium bergeronii]MBS6063701.1 restriction endonuclease subunit S [Peptostreptococcaceae bacterium]
MKCIEDEIPFDVPDGWEWIRLGVAFAHNTGKALNSSNTEGQNLTYITTSNLYWDKFELNALKEMSFTDSEIEKCTVKKGDLLVCEGGDIGRSAIWNYDNEIRIQNHIHRLRGYDSLSNRFYYYVLYLWKFQERIGGHGIGLQGLSSKALHNIFVPLPPIREQFAIVEKLDLIFNYIKDLECQKDDFLLLVENIKSKILDLAIQGKLVPQNPDDEPASVLLDRIRAEKEELIKAGKIKRDKKESVIFKCEDNSYYEKVENNIKNIADKIPFEIPESWTFVRLEDVLDYEQPTPYIVKSTDYKYDYQTPVLTAGKSLIIGYTNETYGIKTELPVIIFDDFTTDSKYVDFPFKVKSSAMKILTAKEKLITTKFAYYAMQVVECDNYNHKRYWISEFSKKLIPLPPKNEQVKIVNAIEELYKYIEQTLS